ncbi:MAG TPA: thiamine phosphate synthase [Gemmatimonadales bacterium]|jgi:thiamine-phosphate pyrophosphorylase|nr:thiamine phosphate synthase [Gemmatimonadales bacterium]
MSPLVRVLAVTNDPICRGPDFSARAAALAGAGPGLGLLVRAPDSTTAQQAGFAHRALVAARPGGASVLVHARPDLARALGAAGVQLRRHDLAPADARRVLAVGWIGVSVHSRADAEVAIAEGADFVVAGNVFATTSHPHRPARGLAWLEAICALERPVIAIGGITPERAPVVRAAGAWGAAAISALWDAADPAAAARAMLAAWNSAT